MKEIVTMLLKDLGKPSTVSIHFVPPGGLKNDLSSLRLAVLEGSIAKIKTDKELFSVIAPAMNFPDYFGNNWDALDECLRDMSWLPADGYILALHDSTEGWSQSPYILGCFVTAWLGASEQWAKEGKPFHLIFLM